MTIENLVLGLKEKAAKDKVFNDICTVFATRERARYDVTVNGLTQRMKKDGFAYSPSELSPALRYLASLGLGQLKTSGGKVVGLSEVKTTLQSIGSVALGQTNSLVKFHKRHQFHKLPAVIAQAEHKLVMPKNAEPRLVDIKPAKAPKKPLTLKLNPVEQVMKEEKGSTVTLSLNFKGTDISIPVPRSLSANDIATLVKSFQAVA